MALVALVTILPLYLANDLELSTVSRGFHIGLLIAIGLIAKPVAGYLSDRLGRKQVLVPGLLWSCLVALALAAFGSGTLLTITVALLGLFLYPDQPILTAAVFDVVGREVASTGLGVVACASFFMSAVSPLIAGALYEAMGFDATAYYIAGLFALAAVVFWVLPMSGDRLAQPAA
jgi:ACDE family multidrug resistance protein